MSTGGGLRARAEPFGTGRAGRERGACLVPGFWRQAGAAGRDRRRGGRRAGRGRFRGNARLSQAGTRAGAGRAGMVLSRVGRPSYQEREAMTSRQPGVTPPGEGSERGEGASAEPALTAQDWLMRLLPLVLLIVAGLAGLRGAAGAPRWDGPLHQDAVVVSVALEVVIVILFVILLLRRTRGSQEATAVKL